MTSEERLRASYDELPYPAEAQVFTHPDHLAVLALLHGLEPAPPERCRVLEVGCADGANLLPMAYALPESRFLGVDLAPGQIEDGRRTAGALGLANLELRAQSLLDFEDDGGPFDYLIVHGVYSWVGAEVQEGILRLCRTHLAPHGLAYVSYNTYPGWHSRGMVREMMRYHTRGVPDPRERVAKAVEWIAFLESTTRGVDDSHARFLRETLAHLDRFRDQPSYLFHEYLAEENTALYFHRFAERAAAHGLRYVVEADPSENPRSSAGLSRQLAGLSDDPLVLEQYFDFVLHRAFRGSLLCRVEAQLRAEAPGRIERLFAATAVDPAAPDVGVASDVAAEFRTPAGRTFHTSHRLAKAVFVGLAEIWPRALAFDELLDDARTRLGAAVDAAELADFLESSFFAGVIELLPRHLLAVPEVSARPRAWGLARRQAERGLAVVNPRHQTVRVDGFIRHLLVHLDGERGVGDLAALLGEPAGKLRADLEKLAACVLLEA